jgi:hypothetical protein
VIQHAGGDLSGSEIPKSLDFSVLRPSQALPSRQTPGAMDKLPPAFDRILIP